MKGLWKYALIAVVAFALGSVSLASAAGVQRFVLTNKANTNQAKIGTQGRLHVNALVNNFPKVQAVRGSVNVGNLPLDELGRVEVSLPDEIAPLLTQVADGVVMNAGDTFYTPYFDSTPYKHFRLYLKADGEQIATNFQVHAVDSFDGTTDYGRLSVNDSQVFVAEGLRATFYLNTTLPKLRWRIVYTGNPVDHPDAAVSAWVWASP